MDEFRLAEMRWSIRRTTLIASVVLVTLNTVGQQLASDAAYLTSLKKVLYILLDGVSEGWVRTCLEFIGPEYPHAPILCSTDLVAVLEAILMSRQPHDKLYPGYERFFLPFDGELRFVGLFGGRPKTRAANLAPTIEKLQYLYENLMSNNFFKTAVLKKNMNICKLKLHNKGFYQQIFWAVTALKFQQTLALDFPHICLQFFPGNFSRLEEKFLQTNV